MRLVVEAGVVTGPVAGADAAGAVAADWAVQVATSSELLLSAGDEVTDARAETVVDVGCTLTRTVVASPAGKKSSGQLTVDPDAEQPGPLSTCEET